MICSEHPRGAQSELHRQLGLTDAVTIGLGAMLGAGIFVALAPAAEAAGSGLLLALALAAVVAYCNAQSSARLAALYPQSGGSYVYGRERLGPFWGYLAGWAFVIGKLASCAAIALAVGVYAWPGHERLAAVIAVSALTAVNYMGVQKSARLTRVIVAVVLVVLAMVVTVSWTGDGRDMRRLAVTDDASVTGVLQAAGLLFFAFAGYVRIATLGAEVREPRRTIPRAISISLAVTLSIYLVVAIAVVSALGSEALATSTAPLADVAVASGRPGLVPVVQAGAIAAALGALLALILGVSRTCFAMAQDHHLPTMLTAVHPRFGVPHRAELAVGVIIVVLVMLIDLRGAIGFSSFGVLTYYAIANLSARTLRTDEDRPPRFVPAVGLVGCVVLAFSLPILSVAAGCAVVAAGAGIYLLRNR